MNKCIIFAVLAFAACVAANPAPGLLAPYNAPYGAPYSVPYSSPVVYGAPLYAKPVASYAKPAAAAAASAAASAPAAGYVKAVPSYSILGSGYGSYAPY